MGHGSLMQRECEQTQAKMHDQRQAALSSNNSKKCGPWKFDLQRECEANTSKDATVCFAPMHTKDRLFCLEQQYQSIRCNFHAASLNGPGLILAKHVSPLLQASRLPASSQSVLLLNPMYPWQCRGLPRGFHPSQVSPLLQFP